MTTKKKPKSNLRNHTCYDMYRYYTMRTLRDNPTFQARYDTVLRVKDIHIIFKIVNYVKTFIIDYRTFRNVIELYNTKMADAVIDGERIYLGFGLGYIQGHRIERSFKEPSIDFGSTAQARRKDPNAAAIYYTDEDYCRIAWTKQRRAKMGYVKNAQIYEFVPAKTEGGFRSRFSQKLLSSPMHKYKFHYIPLTRTIKKT